MNKALTVELIVMKTKNNHMHTIQKLNLWGNDINDISICSQMPALEVLSLAVNNIFTLKDLKGCTNLKELYLRKNMIASLSELRHLSGLQNLSVLQLMENPVASDSNYRLAVIKALP